MATLIGHKMPDDTWAKFATLGALAAVIGLGKELRETKSMTVKGTLGRMICSAGLGGSASFLVYFTPNAPLFVQMGLACALATLGTDVFTSILVTRLGVKA